MDGMALARATCLCWLAVLDHEGHRLRQPAIPPKFLGYPKVGALPGICGATFVRKVSPGSGLSATRFVAC